MHGLLATAFSFQLQTLPRAHQYLGHEHINHGHESHLRYGCQLWYQFGTQTTQAKIDMLQKKVLRIMSFSDFRDPSLPLFRDWKILKLKDLVEM